MLQPGGEAEEKGFGYSDKVIRVGEVWVDGEDEIKAAVAKHAARARAARRRFPTALQPRP